MTMSVPLPASDAGRKDLLLVVSFNVFLVLYGLCLHGTNIYCLTVEKGDGFFSFIQSECSSSRWRIIFVRYKIF